MQLLHTSFPTIKFDVSNIKLPKMKKGYIGEGAGDENNRSDIPLFTFMSKKAISKGTTSTTPVIVATSNNGDSTMNPPSVDKNAVVTVPASTVTLGANNNTNGPAVSNSAPPMTNNTATKTNNNGNSNNKEPAPSTPQQPATVTVSGGPSVQQRAPAASATAPPMSSRTTPPTVAVNSTNVTPTTPLTAAALNAMSTTPNSTTTSSRRSPPGVEPLSRRLSSGTAGRLSIVVLPGPPKMVGWLRKQGHIVRNWKERYFVLNNGYMTYYVDKSDKPPFGKDSKGQICLAGFRIVAGEDGSSQSSMTIANNETTSKVTNSNNRILLKFDSTILDPEMVTYLRKAGTSSTSSNTDDHASEMLLEAKDNGERERWIAAIESHTLYIETASLSSFNKSKQVASGPSMMEEEDDVEIQFQSATDFTSEANNTIIDNSQDVTAMRGEQDSIRRASFSTVLTANTMASVSGQQARKQIRSSMSNINSQKWTVYVERYEEIVCSGVISKPNPLGVIYLVRELILVQTNPHKLSEEARKKPYTYKRLLYVDTNSYDLRGEICWQTDSKKNPTVKKVSLHTFFFSLSFMSIF